MNIHYKIDYKFSHIQFQSTANVSNNSLYIFRHYMIEKIRQLNIACTTPPPHDRTHIFTITDSIDSASD